MARKSYWEKLKDYRWQEKRLRIFERDNFECQRCLEKEGKTLHVDHGYYERNKDPWEYDDSTLTTFCEKCHEEVGDLRRDVHFEIALMGHEALSELSKTLALLRKLAGDEISQEEGVWDLMESIGRLTARFKQWKRIQSLALRHEGTSLDESIALGMGCSA